VRLRQVQLQSGRLCRLCHSRTSDYKQREQPQCRVKRTCPRRVLDLCCSVSGRRMVHMGVRGRRIS